MSAAPADALTQTGYHWRHDDGTEVSATAAAESTTPYPYSPNGATKRLRFGAANAGSETELVKKATLTLASGETTLQGAAIDAANGFAYFTVVASPGKVVKIRLSDFTEVGALTLNSGENNPRSIAVDTVNGHLYVGTDTSPGIVVKIQLSDFTRVGALTLNSGENTLRAASVDAAGTYAYFSTFTTPSQLVKIQLSDFTRVGALAFNTGEDNVLSGTIDGTGGFAYFATSISPGIIVKVDLSSFTRTGAITMNSGENTRFVVVDSAGGYLYAGTSTSPGIIVRIALSTFTRVDAITLDAGNNSLLGGALDAVNGFVYFVTGTSPGKIVKIRTSDFTLSTIATFDSGDNSPRSAVIDVANGYVYAGTIFNTPDKVIKVSVAPKAKFRLEYAPNPSVCSAVVSWTQVPTGTAEHWQIANAAGLTDGATTTNLSGLADGNTSFKRGYVKDTGSETEEISLGEREFTEVEYALASTTAFNPHGGYCFRVSNAGTALASYAAYAETRPVPIAIGGSSVSTVTVLSPNGGERLRSGEVHEITWTRTSGTIPVVGVRLLLSVDGGQSYSAITSDIETDDGRYAWTVPAGASAEVRIKIESLREGGLVSAQDSSDADFAIEVPASASAPMRAHDYDPDAERDAVPSIDIDKGLAAVISPKCRPGSLFRGTTSTVYYCGIDGKRYPFSNERAYFSWFADFSSVEFVENSLISAISLGEYVTYRPGVRMVKIQTDAKVYAVSRGGLLREISDEMIATDLYGRDWASKIDDIHESFFSAYRPGIAVR